MLHILLLILKIIGIMLLAIIALALLILFFPIKYIGKAQADNKVFSGNIKIGWLFRLIYFRMDFSNEDTGFKLKILGIPIINSKKQKKEKKTQNTKKDKEEQRTESFEDNRDKPTVQDSEIKYIEYTKDSIDNSASTEKIIEKEKKQENGTPKKKKSEIFKKVKQKYTNIKDKIKNTSKNVKDTLDKAKNTNNFLKQRLTKEVYRYVKNIILKLLRHIKPRKIRADVMLGFEQPHITGRVLGYIAIAYGTLGINPKHIVITPDFEKKIIKGRVMFKGYVISGFVLIKILKLYFKKEINDIIKKFI